MASVRLGENVGVSEEIIKEASSMATIAHGSSPARPYVYKEMRGSNAIILAFSGSWTVNDLYGNSGHPYGATRVDAALFPSLKYIGLDEAATVNEAFVERFKTLKSNQQFISEVEKAVADGKQVVFTGHSTGAPIAILMEIWFLEHHITPISNRRVPICITFGSPLVGDRVMNHALRREGWSRYFIHFVMRYDIMPRVMLAPRSSVEVQLQHALGCISQPIPRLSVAEASVLFLAVLRNAASVASFAACKIMGNTNPLSETLSSIINLSPYRPCGTYVFCIGNGKLVIARNPDAVLQILFYSLQLSHESELGGLAQASLRDHLFYEQEITESLDMQSITCLEDNHLLAIPLSSRDANVESATIFNDLGLSVRARLCLRAAAEMERKKSNKQAELDRKKPDITESMRKLRMEYKPKCRSRNLGYYEAFKKAESEEDFHANIRRLELAGMWDEMVEMLKRYELPDEFECKADWIQLGTEYRRLVEPLDIANYYRHLKNEDTGTYMERGRPKRYKCTQRWLEHTLRRQNVALGTEHAPRALNDSLETESCFWAELEELSGRTGSQAFTGDFQTLESKILSCIRHGSLSQDALDDSTYKTLKQHFPNVVGQYFR